MRQALDGACSIMGRQGRPPIHDLVSQPTALEQLNEIRRRFEDHPPHTCARRWQETREQHCVACPALVSDEQSATRKAPTTPGRTRSPVSGSESMLSKRPAFGESSSTQIKIREPRTD
jgi:hypothetical protein